MRALVFAAALLVLGAAPAGAGIDLDLDEPDPVSVLEGVAPTEIGAAAETATGLYVYLEAVAHQGRLDRLRARWLPVHACEQGTDWYVDGYTSDGHFQGGMGHNADNYISIRGHSANLDTPDEQMFIAEVAHRMGVRWAPSCEARLGPEL